MTIRDPSIEPFFIEVEDNEFTLKETCTVSEGENIGNTYEMTRGYFTKLEAALIKAVRIKISREDTTLNLKEFIEKYVEEYKIVQNSLKELL